jgi:alkylation response protein AidB-like acyl-CoA dehydrogenase
MTAHQSSSSFVDAAGQIAAKLAETATTRDKAGQAPFVEVDVLRQSGLLKLLIPVADGGLGGRWPDALEVTRTIAAGDGSIGQLIGYHYVNSLTPELAGTPTQGVAYRRKVAQKNWFVADSVNPLDPGLTARKESGRFILNGSKSFSTGALIANSIVIAFPHNDKTYLTALPRETPGLRPNDDWDNIGQRLTVSGTVTFDDVAVPEEALIGSPIGPDSPPSPRATIFIPLVQAVFAHLYLGIAEGALNAAARYTREQGRAWFKSGVAAATDDPIIQVQYGELVAELAASLALARAVGDRLQEALDRGEALTADERAEVAVETFKSKVHATRTALAVTNKIFEVTGSRATASKYGFDLYWRNVRTHTLHDPVLYKAREIGEYFLSKRAPEFTFYS